MTPLALILMVATAQGFEAAPDGGFAEREGSLDGVMRRVLEAHLPARADGAFVFSDSRAPGRELKIKLWNAGSQPGTVAAGRVEYANGAGAPVRVTKRSNGAAVMELGGTYVALELSSGRARRVGDELEILQGSSALFRVRVSVPFEWNGTTIVVRDQPAFEVRVEVALTSVVIAETPSTPIAPAWGAAMAWDDNRQRLVRVGGANDSAFEAATWGWDESTGWVDLMLSSPPPRVRGAMVWDPVRKTMLYFGGHGRTSDLNDTWVLDVAGWRQVTPALSPSPRSAHGLVWDENRQRAVLFGGLTASGTELGDTWEWDGVDWSQVWPATAPSPRDAHGMAWDGNLGETVLFGGWDGQVALADTWSWNGTRWLHRLTPRAPGIRASTNMTWDARARRVVLTGGWDPRAGPAVFDDTWAFDGLDWSPLPPAPSRWMRMAMAFHPRYGVMAFGGQGDSLSTVFSATLSLGSGGWRTVGDLIRLRGALYTSPRTNKLELLAAGGTWEPAPDRWQRTGVVPFDEATHAIATGTGVLALVKTDAGSVDTWVESAQGTWSLAAGAPTARSLAWDAVHEQTWLLAENRELFEWTGSQWLSHSRLPPETSSLHAAPDGGLLLVGDEVSHFDPSSGTAARIAPLPDDAGGLRLLGDTRRDLLVASGSLFTEWDGTRWDDPGERGVFEWVTASGAQLVGWSGDAGFASYQPLRATGAACTSARQCESGFCTDGRCCTSACAGGASDCEACSVAAGGSADGTCTFIRGGVRVLCARTESPCSEAYCAPNSRLCPEPVSCEPDASVDAGQVVADAGHAAPDAGSDETPPRPCGCSHVPTAFAWLLLPLVLMRRRRDSTGGRE